MFPSENETLPRPPPPIHHRTAHRPARPACSFEIAVSLPEALRALENLYNFSLRVRLEKPNGVTVVVVRTSEFIPSPPRFRACTFAEWNLRCVLEWVPTLPVHSWCAKVTFNEMTFFFPFVCQSPSRLLPGSLYIVCLCIGARARVLIPPMTAV